MAGKRPKLPVFEPSPGLQLKHGKIPVITDNFISKGDPFTPAFRIGKINYLSVLYFTDPLNLFICYLSTLASGMLPTKQQDNE